MKTIIFCMLISMIFCANKLRQSLIQEYQDETRDFPDFGNIDQCKIAKCIKAKSVERWGILYNGEYSEKFNEKQQECFYHCQILVCEEKAAQKSTCQVDKNGQKYEKIFNENELGYRDYAPTQEKIKAQLAFGEDEELQRFLEKHHY